MNFTGATMNSPIKLIEQLIAKARPEMHFLNWLFGQNIAKVLDGETIVLYGTGNLGRDMLCALKNHGISPVCFCDSNKDRTGSFYHGLPVISPEQLASEYSKSLIVISSQTYAADIKKSLINLGIEKNKIVWPADFDMATALFFTPTNQITINRSKTTTEWLSIIAQNSEKIERCYKILDDDKSKQVFVEKIATMVNYENIGVFCDFLKKNSEPIKDFGLICFKPYGAENFYYFNNDVYEVNDNETYIDIGAHDGDSVIEFIQACKTHKRKYKKIIAFEPDPNYFRELETFSKNFEKIQCVNSGIWSKKAAVRFRSSNNSIVDGSAGIQADGDIVIPTISLDDFLLGQEASLIKMDPPGNIIPQALEGAKDTIRKHKPKLILGAYHSFEAIFEIPLLVHEMDPRYRLYLRHNSWGIGETDLYAIPQ